MTLNNIVSLSKSSLKTKSIRLNFLYVQNMFKAGKDLPRIIEIGMLFYLSVHLK